MNNSSCITCFKRELLGKTASHQLIMNCTPIVRHHLTFGGAFIMAKFSIEEKLRAVERYLSGTESQQAIADSIGVHKAGLQTWIKQYQFNGERAFEKGYTSYTLQFKLDV